MLSFFFKEIFSIFLLYFQSFEQLIIVNAPLLLTIAMNSIVDLLFEPIGARTNAAAVMMLPLMSKDLSVSLCFRENKDDKELSFALP